MSRTRVPVDEAGWERLAGAILKAELKLAGMSYGDLQTALRALGVEQSTSNISAKLTRGRFSAVFLLQVLVAAGVEDLQLPTRDQA